MVGDMGRTELAVSAEEGARMLFETVKVHQRFAESDSFGRVL
jgi:hypothetical protein